MTITTSPDTRSAPATSDPGSEPTDHPAGRMAKVRPPLLGSTSSGRSGGIGRAWRQRSAFDPHHVRTAAIVVGILIVLALAVPLGLSRLSGGRASAGDTSAGPMQVQRDGSVEAPEGVSGASGSAGTTDGGGVATPNAPDVATKNGTVTSGPAIAPMEAKIARSAWLGLQVTDLAGAAGRARMIASSAGGTVLTEDVVTAVDPVGGNTTGGQSGGSPSQGGIITDGMTAPTGPDGVWRSVGLHQARLTLSVPAEKLDGVLTELSALGTVSYRSAQAQDVTAAYVDTRARIEPARASIERVRALMAKSTDLQQLLALESELTRRQSDLDSLTQQLADLEKRTATSDVTVALWTPAAADEVVTPDDGVVGQLRGAWQGLLSSLTVVLTGIAVLLPWLLVIGLIALVTTRVMRRRRTTEAPNAPAMAPVAATAPATAPAMAPASSGTTPAPATAPTSPTTPTAPTSTD